MSFRKVLPLLAILGLGALSCSSDTSDSSCGYRDCRSGVAIDLGAPQDTYAQSLPLSVHVCFDASCDDVTIVRDRTGVSCGGIPGVGAPDQLTGCYVRDDGHIEIDIGRTDGKSYGDGAPHTIAVSMLDGAGHLVHEKVASVGLSPYYPNGSSCGPVCYQDELSLQ